jgi:hypothetical protein
LPRLYDFQRLTPEVEKALSIAAEHFEAQERMLVQITGPCVIERSSGARGDNNNRTRAMALAAETHKLFGSFLYGTVATVVTVGLTIKPAILAKSVHNWCSGLTSQ